MLIAGPLYASYGGRAYWAMAIIAAVGAGRQPGAAAHALSPTAPARAARRAHPRRCRPSSRSRASSSGPSRSTQSASCASSSAGAMASEVATMQPTMILRPASRAAAASSERLGQPARLVELDVDGVVAAGQLGKARAGVQRFIGAHRHRMRASSERSVGARRQRLLDQLDAGLGGNAHQLGQQGRRPGLVGVGDQARVRAGGAHLAHAPVIAGPAELEFEQRQAALDGGGCLGGHRIGSVEAERVGGGERAQSRQAGERCGRGAVALGLVVPQRAVERVAGGAGGQLLLQGGAAGQPADAFDGGAHAYRPSRRSAHRARIRRGPSCGRR